jgi:hypothetical protein
MSSGFQAELGQIDMQATEPAGPRSGSNEIDTVVPDATTQPVQRAALGPSQRRGLPLSNGAFRLG